VVVVADGITSSVPYYVLLQNVINPVDPIVTSFFTVSVEVGSSTTEIDNNFARLLISAAPVFSNASATFEADPVVQVVGQGTAYRITLLVSTFGLWYSES
jgi:hypothetical protein